MKMIVGLGNPGKKYEGTRHNIGFTTLDELGTALNIDLNKKKFQSLCAESHVQGEKVLLMKPQTYMNRSGLAIQQAIHFYSCSPEDVLVIYDDLDLPLGRVKLRMKGGTGGHNGLKSIVEQVGSKQFKRVRMGIDKPEDKDVTSYVLGAFAKREQDEVQAMIDHAVKACLYHLQEEDFSKVMNRFNVS